MIPCDSEYGVKNMFQTKRIETTAVLTSRGEGGGCQSVIKCSQIILAEFTRKRERGKEREREREREKE